MMVLLATQVVQNNLIWTRFRLYVMLSVRLIDNHYFYCVNPKIIIKKIKYQG
jgi:hypothetical protein